ncbi:MAG: valine--pyruvate transaminase [Planctomycetota bacterium]
MKYPLSTFGRRLASQSGIGELMQDLGEALASGDPSLCMLGGGQPSHIPEVDAIWQRRLGEIAGDSKTTSAVLGDYQPPGGDAAVRAAIADLFRRHFDWPIETKNVAITLGGQSAFFMLFNAFAGRFEDGSSRRVLLPLVPEYIGYGDQSTTDPMFRGVKPLIHHTGPHEFKYGIDFDSIEIDDEIAAICVSRPTNPSANVITDEELERLAELASQHNIPLIVDNAYGNPFPGVIFTETRPIWRPGMILTYSLSKLGLPGTRTGIVIADEEVISAVSGMNAIAALANNNIGQAIVKPLIENDEILRLSRDVIRPFYIDRAATARAWIEELFDDSIPYHVHKSEGAFFFWLWLEGLPITSRELYERLKRRGCLVISGHYFFFGLDDTDWKHRDECLRISFTAPESVLRRGLEILAEEVRHVYETVVAP